MQASNGAAKFSPPANVPQAISLKWVDGLDCQSPYNGDQVLFTLTDGRKWYTDPALGARIRALDLTPGEEFEVTRVEVRRGNHRSFEWQLARIEDEPVPAEAALPAPASVAPAAQQPAPSAPSVPTHPTPPPAVNGPTKAALIESGRIAVDAVIAVEAYAHDNGFAEFSFGGENIQKIWLAVFIDAQRRYQR